VGHVAQMDSEDMHRWESNIKMILGK